MSTLDREASSGSRLIIANRYEIDLDNPLGVGGMAMVYRGEDLRSRRKVAIKTLSPEYQRNPDSRRKFRQEARMMAFVSHPNLVTIYDLHDESNGSWMVMEHVAGRNLKEILEEEGPLDPETVMGILDQVGKALGHMHARKLVHLDVKPQNLIQMPDGTIKLIDFGLAQMTGTSQEMVGGTAFGTVAYLAPEQASGETVDAATDVYSLGCVIYELLTGRPPFVADGADQKRQLIDAHLNDLPQAPSTLRPELELPGWIDDVLGWALAKQRRERFHDVDTFVRMFEAGLDGEAIPHLDHTTALESPAPSGPVQTGVFRRRSWQPVQSVPRVQVAPATAASAIPDARPVSPSVPRRIYRQGGKLARRSRRFLRTIWRLTAVLAIGNLLLALVLMAQSGPSALVERFLSIAPGTSTEVVVDGLNLREGPGADSAVIAVLANGQKVKVIGLSEEDAQGRWWPVEVNQDGQHMEGWVWEGGLQPNAWTGRLSWMQDIVDGVVGVRDRVTGFVDDVTGLIPGLRVLLAWS
jgi:serine/threonine protein kinase